LFFCALDECVNNGVLRGLIGTSLVAKHHTKQGILFRLCDIHILNSVA